MPTPVLVEPSRPTGHDTRLGAPRVAAVGLLVVASLGLGVLRYLATDDRFSSGLERILQAGAFSAIAIAPAGLAVLSSRRRAVLLVPAAIVLWPLAMSSLAGVLLPLLIPAVLLWVAFATRYDGLPCGIVRGLAATGLVLALLVASAAVLVVHQDPRSYGDCTMTAAGGGSASGSCPAGALGGGSTSDVVTSAEAVLSLGLVAGALLAGWVIAAPRRSRRP